MLVGSFVRWKAGSFYSDNVAEKHKNIILKHLRSQNHILLGGGTTRSVSSIKHKTQAHSNFIHRKKLQQHYSS